MLTVTDLSVRYGQIEAVRGLGLSVAKGSVTVLLGSNGAGKSSTLNAIAGLAAPRGRIEFEGSRIDGQAPEDIVRKGIALCPEGRRVFPSLSVAENLHLGGAVHATGDELAARIEAELARFPILRERYHQKAGLLSGGEQQMLAIARALMSAPRLLLLDEPSLGLAPKVVDQVFDLILTLRDQGITILLVEQNAERALEIADRGYVLQSGDLVLSGTGEELAQSDLIRQAYLAG
ncbi:MAG: ABC transporter ATP-binding protein [Tabrizicola sp.]|nr:ABC transporter ATP-binding protein [Tabrizicola sp.]